MLLFKLFNSNYMVEQARSIPKADAKKSIGSKDEFYRGLSRIGYHLPGKKSTICTKRFLIDVREKRCWMP